MSDPSPRVLVLGYGNPGRRDDGLGPAAVEALERLALPGVETDSDYQLRVEDAERVATASLAVFVDAAAAGPAPYAFGPVAPRDAVSFTTHVTSPGEVLGIARRLFGAEVPGWLLAVRGYDFDGFGEGLSDPARENLADAVRFLASTLLERSIGGAAAGRPVPSGA